VEPEVVRNERERLHAEYLSAKAARDAYRRASGRG
jgi:hypothetical protein